eukprot:TRINITY_DN16381_c0_g1_i1.p1 TRINITY_DN16381_c0_g1~~TRINITY_DN16381_c0_g1_i1.p1  ORF type:complete len:607 (-),score=180.52 TRINITY_DN16381_c0_g1_i1:106-1821(-)
MVVLLRCRCLNVTVHLQNLPAEDTNNDYDWLNTTLTTSPSHPQRFGRAELGVAGIKVEVEKLLAIKQVTKDWKPWNCVCCINCGVSLYAYDVSKPNVLAVNQNLLKSQEEIDKLQKSSSYSPTFKIVLEDEDAISNNPLESPDVFDAQLWNKLQKQVDETVKREETAHQQLIEEFVREQQRLLMERQSKAYRDRKIIWHKICKQQSSSSSSQKTESTPQSTPATTPSPVGTTSAPIQMISIQRQQDKSAIPSSSFSTTAVKPMGRDRTSTGNSPFAASPSGTQSVIPSSNKLSTTPTTTTPTIISAMTTPVSASVPTHSTIMPPTAHSPTIPTIMTSAATITTPSTNTTTAALSSTFSTSTMMSDRDRSNTAGTTSGNVSRSFVLKPILENRNVQTTTPSSATMSMKKEGRGLLSATKERTVEPLAVAAAAAAAVAAPIFPFEGDGEVTDMAASDFEGNKVTDMAFTEESSEQLDDLETSFAERREAADNEMTKQMLTILSSSVPVSIPLPSGKKGTTFSLITEDEDDAVPKYSQTYKRPHEIVEEEAEINEMSKSFAVPLSMTRRIKSFI